LKAAGREANQGGARNCNRQDGEEEEDGGNSEKRDPIEPEDSVEYRTIKKKREKDTVAKPAQGKGKVAKQKGGERKRGYKKRVTQPTTTSPNKKKARRGK
jgi:hypothetical protein